MANPTSKLDLVVNGVTTSYDIHDANAIPRSGGNVITGTTFNKTANDSSVTFCGGMGWDYGASITLSGKDRTGNAGNTIIRVKDNSNTSDFILNPNGTATWNNKNLAMQEDVIPRSGGAVLARDLLASSTAGAIGFGQGRYRGGTIYMFDSTTFTIADRQGSLRLEPYNATTGYIRAMTLRPDGTWTWDGQPVQIGSDARLKQQITEIDDKLLDAWEDVNLVQFKYNDAVDQKGDNARLHTGYVVQQIQKACESHGVDISAYGLFCHEEYPEETEEVEVEQKDGTKTKERKVIREANEHYSLRYTEALIVECKYLRRCIERLVARVEQLEGKNKETEK